MMALTPLNVLTLLPLAIFCVFLTVQWLALKRYKQEASVRDEELSSLRNELQTLMSCSQGVGASLHKQQRQIRNLLQRQDKIEQLDTGHTQYGQAITMLRRGADNQEIADSCGLSSGELDLIKRMNP